MHFAIWNCFWFYHNRNKYSGFIDTSISLVLCVRKTISKEKKTINRERVVITELRFLLFPPTADPLSKHSSLVPILCLGFFPDFRTLVEVVSLFAHKHRAIISSFYHVTVTIHRIVRETERNQMKKLKAEFSKYHAIAPHAKHLTYEWKTKCFFLFELLIRNVFHLN